MAEGAGTTRATPAGTGPGRPRDPRIDASLREAVHALLVEDGYLGLTVQGAARRAGVSPAAVYRRFAGKRELVEWAVFPTSEWEEPAWRGDLPADLRLVVQVLLSWLCQPAVRAALPGVLTELVADPQRSQHLLRASAAPVRDSVTAMLARMGSDVDGEALFDAVVGACLLEAIVSGTAAPVVVERITQIAHRAAVGPPGGG